MRSIGGFPNKYDQKLRDIAEQEGYSTYKIRKQHITTGADSYFAQLYEVDIQGEKEHREDETSLFVKINNSDDELLKGMPTTRSGDYDELNLFIDMNNSDAEHTSGISMTRLFGAELLAYKEVFKIFVELQDELNIPAQERFRMVKCFEGSSIAAIILENIAKKGYTTFSTVDVVSLEFARMSIGELAKFHALSFALELKRPEYFDRRQLKNIKYPFTFGDQWKGYSGNMIKAAIVHVDDEIKDKVERSYYKLASKYEHYINGRHAKRCLSHGDLNICNLMVKKDGEELKDMIMVDYQFLLYTSPVIDFLYFIFMSTDKKFRDAHLSDLKDLYHKTFSEFLKHLDIDVELVFSRKDFDEAYKELLGYGLMVGLVVLPLKLVAKEDAPDLTQVMTGVKLNDVVIERQRGMVEEFMDWGYIVE